MKRMHVKLTFIEPVLGTWPSNQNIAREFIASKSPDAASIEDEVAAIGADAVADKGMTVFPRNDDGQPVLYDYQVKGFFKDACGMLSRVGGKTETAFFRECEWNICSTAPRRRAHERRGERGQREQKSPPEAGTENGTCKRCTERSSYCNIPRLPAARSAANWFE